MCNTEGKTRNDADWSTRDRIYYTVYCTPLVAGASVNCVMRMWKLAFCAKQNYWWDKTLLSIPTAWRQWRFASPLTRQRNDDVVNTTTSFTLWRWHCQHTCSSKRPNPKLQFPGICLCPSLDLGRRGRLRLDWRWRLGDGGSGFCILLTIPQPLSTFSFHILPSAVCIPQFHVLPTAVLAVLLQWLIDQW